MEQFFFRNSKLCNGMASSQKINKGFLNHHLLSVKTACVCIVFFFHYFKYYGQNIFLKNSGALFNS